MEVSEHGGTPKCLVYNGKTIDQWMMLGGTPMTYRKAPTVKICHAAHRESQLRWFPGQPGPKTPGESWRM